MQNLNKVGVVEQGLVAVCQSHFAGVLDTWQWQRLPLVNRVVSSTIAGWRDFVILAEELKFTRYITFSSEYRTGILRDQEFLSIQNGVVEEIYGQQKHKCKQKISQKTKAVNEREVKEE